MKSLMRAATIIILCLFPVISFAQISPSDVKVDSSKTVEIELRNNSTLTGYILSVSDTELELQQNNGRTYLQLSRVRAIHNLDTTRKGTRWFPNPNYSRLFFSPTAQPLQKGSGYYQNIYVLFNNFAYAVSNNITFTGGFSMIPAVRPFNQLFFVTGKVGFEIADGHYFGGGLGAATADVLEDGFFNGYANYTHEFHRGSLTGGVMGFSTSEEIGTYAFYAGANYRILERVSLVTENYVFPDAEDAFIISYGVRLMGEEISFDLALFRPGLGSDIVFGIPYIDFVFNF